MDTIQTDHPAADLALARRLELAEALSNVEFVEARAQAFPQEGGEWIEVAGARAMFDGADSPCTQTFGLGLFEPVTSVHLDRIEGFFRGHGAPTHHETCPLADISFVQLLHERGYQPEEYSNVLYRPIHPNRELPATIDNAIQAKFVASDEADLWARTAAQGWNDVFPELDEYILRLGAIFPYRQGSYCFLAERDGEPIATGAVCLFERVALLAGASTIPRWRKQGAQRALLESRLAFAAEHGCDIAMMVAAPGSTSQRNAERQGFRIAYTRTKWLLPTTRDG